MTSKAETVERYLEELPEDRREIVSAIRNVILENLDADYEEGMQYGGTGYFIPHLVYPPGYHCDPKQPLPFAGISNQKNHVGIYLFCIYGDDGTSDWFRYEWEKTGKCLDMGKGCVRVRKLKDVPIELVGDTIRRAPVKKMIETYEAAIKPRKK